MSAAIDAVRQAFLDLSEPGSTSSSAPLFELSALPERVHVNAIGAFRPAMRELPRDLLADASIVVVDQLEAALDSKPAKSSTPPKPAPWP
jgi:ornithine cyclodeaminase/alanine dehydrogenase-like protein (mu-crystallin family)